MPIPQDAFPQQSDPPSGKAAPAPEWLGAAGLSVVLHGILFALLAWQWQPAPAMSPSHAPVLITQLIAAPAPVATPDMEPKPAMPAPPQPAQQPAPPKPLEDATLARKRQQEQDQAIKQRQQEQQRREHRQRQQAEQLAKEQAERDRLAALAAAEAQRAQELAAQQATEQAAQWAANNHDYSPLNKPTPDYPEQALKRGVEGDCTVEYTVTASGNVDDPRIVGDCHPLFIRASLNAANGFRYQPRRVEGQAQAVANVRNTFHYRIDQQP